MHARFLDVHANVITKKTPQSCLQDEKLYPGMSGYPGYHTGFETFDLVDRIYDPEYKVLISD